MDEFLCLLRGYVAFFALSLVDQRHTSFDDLNLEVMVAFPGSTVVVQQLSEEVVQWLPVVV